MIAKAKNKLFQFFQIDINDGAIGYDVVKDVAGRRRPVSRRVVPQDRKLRNQIKERAIATAQDIQQNFSVASWAIRKHLDYVSDLEFRPANRDDALDVPLQRFWDNWSTRLNCDVQRRHSLRRWIRLAEARRCVDGDFFAMKIGGRGPDRGRLQAIEGYRLKNPGEEAGNAFTQNENTEWINGVEVSKRRGIAIRYSVGHRNMQGNWEWDAMVPAPNMCQVGYYERFDQIRGISPLMAGLTEFTDVYEATDYMKFKLKLAQLFGVGVFREAQTWNGQHGKPTAMGDENQDGTGDSDWTAQFGPEAVVIDGGVNDRVDFFESRVPATEQVDFLRFVLSLALKALDLPDSFLKEGETNFFGSRAALMHYLRSCRSKIMDLVEWLDEISRWRIGMAMADGELREFGMPAGVAFSDLRWDWRWKGTPWAWDPVKEAQGARLAIEAGLDSIERICELNGTTPRENIDQMNRWNDYAMQTGGRPLIFSTSSIMPEESNEGANAATSA